MTDVSCRWARRALALGLVTVALGAPAAALAQGGSAAASRLGWVDLQAILKQEPKYVEAEGTYNKEMKAYNDEVEKLQKQFDSTLADYQQKSTILSPSAKQTKETELRTLQQRIQTRMGELQQKAETRQRELIAPIEDRIKAVIDGVRAERNLLFIFDIQRSGIIAADPVADITALVVQRLKAGGL